MVSRDFDQPNSAIISEYPLRADINKNEWYSLGEEERLDGGGVLSMFKIKTRICFLHFKYKKPLKLCIFSKKSYPTKLCISSNVFGTIREITPEFVFLMICTQKIVLNKNWWSI